MMARPTDPGGVGICAAGCSGAKLTHPRYRALPVPLLAARPDSGRNGILDVVDPIMSEQLRQE